MHLRRYNESEESEDMSRLQPKVKHLIEYLSSLDPEADVYLDKDGWDSYGDNEVDIVKNSGLFLPREGYLMINN